jgi:hypothetical protein
MKNGDLVMYVYPGHWLHKKVGVISAQFSNGQFEISFPSKEKLKVEKECLKEVNPLELV